MRICACHVWTTNELRLRVASPRVGARSRVSKKNISVATPVSIARNTVVVSERTYEERRAPHGGRRATSFHWARHTRGYRSSPACNNRACRNCVIFITRSCDIHCSCIYHRRGAHRRLSIVTTTAGYAAIVFASKLACLLASSSRASIERSCGTESSSHAREACPRRGA